MKTIIPKFFCIFFFAQNGLKIVFGLVEINSVRSLTRFFYFLIPFLLIALGKILQNCFKCSFRVSTTAQVIQILRKCIKFELVFQIWHANILHMCFITA